MLAAAALLAPLTCGPAGPTYAVTLGGAPLFSAPPPLAAFADGAWATSWALAGARDVTGTDALGAFAGTECAYARAGAADAFITVAAYAYAAPAAAPGASAVRFRVGFPLGAARTNHSADGGAAFSTVSNFPAFAGPATPLTGLITWRDAFFAPSTARADMFGQLASAAVFFDAADVAGAAVFLSPLDNFLNAALGDALGNNASCARGAPGCWAAGASATVAALPPGFSQSFVLVAATGITPTVDAWGAVLRAYYGGTSTPIADASVSTLGYTTDNGAQLCFGCPGQVLDACLLDEKAHLDALRVPVNYLSFQNAWWKSGGESAPWCVGEWVPVPAKVPMGMQAFRAAVGLPLQLYAPYFCDTSAYAANFTMSHSDVTLPGCKDFSFYDAAPEDAVRFYEFLFTLGADYGMTMFEPDFLNANHLCIRRHIEEVGAADAFFRAQTGVALARGIPIQWCFATPMLLLWSMSAPAVTNFRVSYDFFYGGSWDTGITSLIVWAAGKAPSKDTFWTTDNGNQSTTRGGCDRKGCPPDHSTPAAALHTMLAVLAAGPVQFSDAPGETDPVLIGRTCDARGALLQPSKPLTAVDSTHDAPGAAPAGFALSTYTAVGGAPWLHLLLSHQLTAPFAVRALDFFPPLAGAGAGYVRVAWADLLACADARAGARCGAAPLPAPAGPHAPLVTLPAARAGVDPFTPTLTLLAPLLPSGVAVFGELDKFATVSVQRFAALRATPAGAAATLAGAPGEAVRLAWWAAARAAVAFVNATFPGAHGGPSVEIQCTFGADGAGACA